MLPLRILKSGGPDGYTDKQLKFIVIKSRMGVYKRFGGCSQ